MHVLIVVVISAMIAVLAFRRLGLAINRIQATMTKYSAARAPKLQVPAPKLEATPPIVLAAPVIGFLNFDGEEGLALMNQDNAAFSSHFRASLTASDKRPGCVVLFIYGKVDATGKIAGADQSLREIIKSCGARIAVIASENDFDHVRRSLEEKSDWASNLIITNNRNGDSFARFFSDLFADMNRGTTLGMSWVKIFPQVPATSPLSREDVPGLILVAPFPNLTFGPDWFPNKNAPAADKIDGLSKTVLAWLKQEYTGSAPSLFSMLGAALGYSVTQSIFKGGYLTPQTIDGHKALLVSVEGKDGRKYVFGELVNWLLFEPTPGRLAAWKLISDVLIRDGQVPHDLTPTLKHVSATVGGENFGIPLLPESLMPCDMPMAALKRLWPRFEETLIAHDRPVRSWPIDIAAIICIALRSSDLPKPEAARIVMEAAIPMSKLGMEAL